MPARVVTGQESVAVSLNEVTTPGFTVFDIRGFWRARENWLLTAGVENVGDIQYGEHLDPISGIDTIGGLVFNQLGHVAKAGERLSLDSVDIKVRRVVRARIQELEEFTRRLREVEEFIRCNPQHPFRVQD